MEKINIGIKEAMELTGFGRDEMYRICELPDFKAFRTKGKIYINLVGLRKWMEALAENRVGFKN